MGFFPFFFCSEAMAQYPPLSSFPPPIPSSPTIAVSCVGRGGVSQTAHSASSLYEPCFTLKHCPKKPPSLYRACALNAPPPLMTSRCCSAHWPWKVSVVSSDTKNLSTGHLALLCSRHHGVTTCIHFYGALIAQVDACMRIRGAFSGTQLDFTSTSCPEKSTALLSSPFFLFFFYFGGEDRSSHVWKLIARMGTHSIRRKKGVTRHQCAAGIPSLRFRQEEVRTTNGSSNDKQLPVKQAGS